MGAICLGLVLLCTAAPALQKTEASAAWLEMPDDPIGRLWASVGDNTAPWEPQATPESAALTWASWAQALGTLTPPPEARGQGEREPFTEPDRAARREASARLIQFALDDDRAEDAFRWLRGLGKGDPEALAGLLPRLFPGVPANTELLPGGRIPPLPAGTTLRPQLPPEPRSPKGRGLSRRSTCRGLQIGGATLDLVMKLDGSGVVTEFTHRGGPPVTFVVHLPAPAGKRLKSLYVDWDLQPIPGGEDEASFDWAATPIQVTIQPQPTGEDSPGYDESYSIFARLEFVEGTIPAAPAAALPATLTEAGLDLVVGGTEGAPAPPGSEPWQEIAAAWQVASGIPVRVITGAAPPVAASLPGTAVHFLSAPDPKLLRRQITGAIEDRRRQSRLLYR